MERSFAHVCETGAGRRTWLRGLAKVRLRHLLYSMAFNLGVMMRKLFKMGTPRSLQDGWGRLLHFILLGWRLTIAGNDSFMTYRGRVCHAA